MMKHKILFGVMLFIVLGAVAYGQEVKFQPDDFIEVDVKFPDQLQQKLLERSEITKIEITEDRKTIIYFREGILDSLLNRQIVEREVEDLVFALKIQRANLVRLEGTDIPHCERTTDGQVFSIRYQNNAGKINPIFTLNDPVCEVLRKE